MRHLTESHKANISQSMKKSRLKPRSDKLKLELVKRSQLRVDLMLEYGNHCMTCQDKDRDWRGISLSHIIPLSRGGGTSRKNCLIECYVCHDKYEKKPELRNNK